MSSSINCFLWNVRSINNKCHDVMNFIVDHEINLLFMSETWLTDFNNNITAEIKSYGYDIHHYYRTDSRGGGVALIFHPWLKITRMYINHPDSFESVSAKIKLQDGSSLFCSCIYRTGNIGNFMEDFDKFLENVKIKFGKLLICGDINLHLDVSNNSQTIEFNNILQSHDLFQSINVPTHTSGHTLDVIINSNNTVELNEIDVHADSPLTFPTIDHFPFTFNVSNKVLLNDYKKLITFRNTRNINFEAFKSDLSTSLYSCDTTSLNFSEMLTYYNSSCSNILDKYAPICTKQITQLPTAPWFDSEYKNARRIRRRAEKCWRRSKDRIDHENFLVQRSHCNELAKQKKQEFFNTYFNKHNHSQKSLFKFVDNFLDHDSKLILPPYDSIQEIANNFNKFFIDKIENIRKNFSSNNEQVYYDAVNNNNLTYMSDFEPTTITEIREILKETNFKTCANDPLPTDLLEKNYEILLPFICDIVNCSLSSGNLDGVKLALITPLIKDNLLDSSDYKNYRPISNLTFIGKLIERVVLRRLNKHMEENNLDIHLQSAYKKYHSTETLLVRVVNDLLIASDENTATVVMLLDLSAAFDTVDHTKLLHILRYEIGLCGKVLVWFKNFLVGRSQRIRINGFESEEIIIKFGVPQGSVLGPILFNIYIRSLYLSVQNKKFNIHGFADDHTVYKSFPHEIEYSMFVDKLPFCFQEINDWMAEHYLLLNPGKTQIIVFGSPNLLSYIHIHGTFIAPGICVRFVPHVKSLGFILDEGLNFRQQVNKLKSSSFNKLRKIARMKPFLNSHQIQILVQSLVLSSLDYCNALYCNIDTTIINQLQLIQNRACKIIFGLGRRDSVSDFMKKLHWLKIRERIEFKLLLLVYKALHDEAPTYLSELIKYNTHSGPRTHTLQNAIYRTSYGNRAFQVCAPRLWNSLPQYIRLSDSTNVFKKRLKQFLFYKSYP